jgi:PhnB protein
MQVQPYLYFDGVCEEALEFYKRTLGAEVTMLMRFKEAEDTSMAPPNAGEKIMHASFTIGETTILASDGHAKGKPEFKGFSLSIDAIDDAAAARLFDGLAKGGKVEMALQKTFYASSFGMVTDRFGVMWMVLARQ